MDQISAKQLKAIGVSEESYRSHLNELQTSGVDFLADHITVNTFDKAMIVALLEYHHNNNHTLSDIDSYLLLKAFESHRSFYQELYSFMGGRYRELMDGNIYLLEHKWHPENNIAHLVKHVGSLSTITKGTIRTFLTFHGKAFSLNMHHDRIKVIEDALLREGVVLEVKLEEILNEVGMMFL